MVKPTIKDIRGALERKHQLAINNNNTWGALIIQGLLSKSDKELLKWCKLRDLDA